MGDVFNNYVADPLKDAAVDSAVEATGMGGLVNDYNELSNDARRNAGTLARTARFIHKSFFQ